MIRQQFENLLPDDPVTTPYLAKEGEEPVGRCLENLELRHENNFFARIDNQRLFVWGVPWHKPVVYDNLTRVSAELLDLERGGVEEQLSFADYHALDFRIPANSKAIAKGCYPKGDVPLVRLGTMDK